MSEIRPIYDSNKGVANVAAFMSGSGSNITRLLEMEQRLIRDEGLSPFHVSVVVTDCADPSMCNARNITSQFGDIPLVELDIRAFYRARGLTRVSLATKEGFQIRDEWTEELKGLLRPFHPDLGAYGGFVPLTNICAEFPCINVHPGDLSVLVDHKPYLVGLHTAPIKRAILLGLGELRSSTILATPYTEKLEMDEGPVLLISEALPLQLSEGENPESLSRPEKAGLLERLASEHQDRLKQVGDWHVFPLTVKLVAEGRFSLDEDQQIYFDGIPIDRGLKMPLTQ